jgi:DNA-binding GntR family transcriptional regulator
VIARGKDAMSGTRGDGSCRPRGLIESHAHRRAVVRPLSRDRLVEAYDLRALLEGYAVERATERIHAARLKELRALEKEVRTIHDHATWLERSAE